MPSNMLAEQKGKSQVWTADWFIIYKVPTHFAVQASSGGIYKTKILHLIQVIKIIGEPLLLE